MDARGIHSRWGIITETTKACLEDLETQRDSLKASILQLQLECHKFTKEQIVDWFSKYKYGNIHDLVAILAIFEKVRSHKIRRHLL